MTEYKATPEQWQDGKHCADAGAIAFACILELRARVEALEADAKQWRTDHLRLANMCASLAPDRLKFFNALLPDDDTSQPTPNSSQIRSSLVERVADGISKPLQLTPEQAQQINDLLAPNSQPTPNPSQIGSSLVERVRKALSYPPEPYARAAIREVAAWFGDRAAPGTPEWIAAAELTDELEQ
jgi:hypothetical protein